MWISIHTLHIGLFISIYFTIILHTSEGGLFRKVKYKDKVKGENDIQLSSERPRGRTHCPLECVCENTKVSMLTCEKFRT